MALTFDAEHPDRPTDPSAEERLLEVLERLTVRATFFLQGRWVEAYPDRARRVAAAGHLIGNHGFYHVRMPLLNDAGLDTDIADAEAAIIAGTQIDPKPWFRCAFGAGADDSRVFRRVAAAGYRHIPWDVEAEDWEPWTTGDQLAEAIVAGALGHGDGAIVLLHSWPTATAAGIEAIVTRLREAGAELTRLDELDGR